MPSITPLETARSMLTALGIDTKRSIKRLNLTLDFTGEDPIEVSLVEYIAVEAVESLDPILQRFRLVPIDEEPNP